MPVLLDSSQWQGLVWFYYVICTDCDLVVPVWNMITAGPYPAFCGGHIAVVCEHLSVANSSISIPMK